MAPKRKAPAAGGRATKRVASGVATPVSSGSEDVYESELSESEPDEVVDEVVDPKDRHKFDSQWPLHSS